MEVRSPGVENERCFWDCRRVFLGVRHAPLSQRSESLLDLFMRRLHIAGGAMLVPQ